MRIDLEIAEICWLEWWGDAGDGEMLVRWLGLLICLVWFVWFV